MTTQRSNHNQLTSITVNDRIGALEEAASAFRNHLIDVRGVALTAPLRLFVTQCAQQAIFCESCGTQLPRHVCLPPHTNIYDAIHKLECVKECQEKKIIVNNNVSEQTQKVLVTIIHSMVNHQGRLDQQWYDNAVESLLEAEDIISNKVSTENRRSTACAAVAEILALSVMAHCIHLAFVVMGRKVPRLPTMEELNHGKSFQQGPTLLDWKSLSRGRTTTPMQRDEKVLRNAYYILSSSIDSKSTEFQRISKNAWIAMKGIMDPMDPRLAVALAVEDVAMLVHLTDVYYLPTEVSKHNNNDDNEE